MIGLACTHPVLSIVPADKATYQKWKHFSLPLASTWTRAKRLKARRLFMLHAGRIDRTSLRCSFGWVLILTCKIFTSFLLRTRLGVTYLFLLQPLLTLKAVYLFPLLAEEGVAGLLRKYPNLEKMKVRKTPAAPLTYHSPWKKRRRKRRSRAGSSPFLTRKGRSDSPDLNMIDVSILYCLPFLTYHALSISSNSHPL